MVARLRRADRGTSCALSARCFEAEARALPVSGAWRLEGHDVATTVATTLNHRLARRRPKPEQHAEQVIRDAPKRTRTSPRLSRTRPSTWRMRASLLPPRTIEPSSF